MNSDLIAGSTLMLVEETPSLKGSYRADVAQL